MKEAELLTHKAVCEGEWVGTGEQRCGCRGVVGEVHVRR